MYIDKTKLIKTDLKISSLDSLKALENLMSLIERKEVSPTIKNKLDHVVELIKALPCYEDVDIFKFVVEQIMLSAVSKNNRCYGNQTMVLASCLYVHSPSAYNALLKCGLIFLPHPRTLQKLICNYMLPNSSLDSSPYLENSVKRLQQHELLVCLLMDKIYIQPQLSFKGGQIYGTSTFDSTNSAKNSTAVYGIITFIQI